MTTCEAHVTGSIQPLSRDEENMWMTQHNAFSGLGAWDPWVEIWCIMVDSEVAA